MLLVNRAVFFVAQSNNQNKSDKKADRKNELSSTKHVCVLSHKGGPGLFETKVEIIK